MICLTLLGLLTSACAQTWDERPPSAAPGGTSLSEDGTVVDGADVHTKIGLIPASNETGTVAPFGFRGENAAYEFIRGYRVGAGDRLVVRVLGQSDLTNTYLVDPSGNISMPLIHTTPVAGMTTAEIEKMIRKKLKKGFLRDPSVSVQVVAQRPFFILGQVSRAGSFPYQAGLTVQQAIALAGGYAPRADQGAVLLTRRNAKGTVSHRVPVTTQLYPGDIVYVRERWF